MKSTILVLTILAGIIDGCRENSKPDTKNLQNADKSVDSRTEEMPKVIVSAKDTFHSIITTIPGGEPEYFEDIHLLTGRYKRSSLKYPCIEIRNIDNKRIVTYHFDQSSQATYIYQRNKNYWLAKFFSTGDTCKYLYTYQYILPDEEISFTYTNKEATWYFDVIIASETRQTYYVPNKGFTSPPDLLTIPTIKKNYDYIHEDILIETGDLVKVQTLRTTNEGVVSVNIANCYSKLSKRYSLKWWETFGWDLNKEIECK